MMSAISALEMCTNVLVEVKDARDGALLFSDRRHNRVPLVGINFICDLLIGATSDHIGWFAVGTGASTPSDVDVALVIEVFRGQMTQTTREDGLVTFSYYLPSTAANGYTLQEAGLWTAQSGGVLLARVVHSPYDKSENVTTTYTWDIEIMAK